MFIDKLKNSNSPLVRKLASIKHLGLIILLIIAFSLLLVMTRPNDTNQTDNIETSGLYTESELRLEKMIESINGVKDATIYINSDNEVVNSVIVVLNSDDLMSTRISVLSAVQTALNITSDKVKIISGNN